LFVRTGFFGRSSRQVTFKAQKPRRITEGRNVLAVFALDDRFNRVGWIMVSPRRCGKLPVYVVYAGLDIGFDRLLRISNVAGGLVAPADSISKLLLVVLHRLQVGPDFGVRGASPTAHPDIVAVEDGCLVG
jgi:hypothetical protein